MVMQLSESYEGKAKSGRLEARVSQKQKLLFKKAAELQGCTLSDFIISTLQAAATKIVHDAEVITLAGRDREIFVAALLKPELPEGRLKKAAVRYKKLMD